MFFVNFVNLGTVYKSGLKSLYDDITSAVDDFLDYWDPNTATPTKEVYRLQGRLYRKINFILSHSMIVS